MDTNESKQNKKNMVGSIATVSSVLVINAFTAACPVCFAIIGVNAGLSKYIGIDDTVSGIWIGALIMEIASLITKKLNNNPKFKTKYLNLIITIILFTLFLIPMYAANIIGDPENVLFPEFIKPIDKLLFGILLGSIGFFAGGNIHTFIKKKNNDKSLFPFQKVVIPISLLTILSVIMFFLTKK